MKTRDLVTIYIYNIVAIVCWTALAVMFDKWWLVLFATFFIHGVKATGCYRRCNLCGKEGPRTKSPEASVEAIKKLGWIASIGPDKQIDICPECQKRFNFNRESEE